MLEHWIVSQNLAFYDTRLIIYAASRNGYTTHPLSPAQGLQGLLELSCCGMLFSGSLSERVAVQPARTDVHHFTSLTLPSENLQ